MRIFRAAALLFQGSSKFVCHLEVMINILNVIIIFKRVDQSQDFSGRFDIELLLGGWNSFQAGLFRLNIELIQLPVHTSEILHGTGDNKLIPIDFEVGSSGIYHFKLEFIKIKALVIYCENAFSFKNKS